jgi:Na+/phosphate symporter
MKVAHVVIAISVAIYGVSLALAPSPLLAVETGYEVCDDPSAPSELKNSQACLNKDKDKNKIENRAATAVNWMFYLIGALATCMIIYGGIKYSTSAGDSNKVSAAKQIITYSVVGLIIAVMGSAITQFIVGNFWK